LKYLLDTNIISEFISKNPNQKVVDFVNSINENDIYLSVITLGEIKVGIEKLNKDTHYKKIDTLLNWLENDLMQRFKDRILEIDTKTILKWGEITAKMQKVGKPMPIMDSLIASTCLVNELVLITRNSKDFYSLDIEMINLF